MADESLIVVWHVLLCIVVPHLDEVVLATCKHVATIVGEISCSACASVHDVEISQVHAFVAGKAIDSDTLVLCDDDDLTIVLCELETSNDSSN